MKFLSEKLKEMIIKRIALILVPITLIMSAFLSCKNYKELPTEPEVDIKRYAGTWYEIARLPNSFEKGLECVTATYKIKDNGKIEVINRGHKIDDRSEVKSAKGTAWVPDPEFPGRLKVRFFWPFAGNYYIIHLDKDYNYALVGDPSRKYLWILSKNKALDNAIYDKLINIAQEQGFESNKMIMVKQDCEN